MKLAAKISSIILLLILFFVPAIAVSSDQKYPEFINGESVIFVQTSENTCWLDSTEVILTILDDSNSIEESIANFDDYLSTHQLPEGWSIQVIGGPGASEEEFLRVHNSFNDAGKKNGGPFRTGGPVQSFTSSENSESTTLASGSSYAIDGTNDPSPETITYIDAEWIAPTVGTQQNKNSYLLVNGFTNTGYFLQSGQLYYNGQGQNVWIDSSTNFYPRPFGIAYVPGHRCYYFIARFTAGWYMGMMDYTSGQIAYQFEPNATGTKLVKHTGTSVFFENWNTNSNWYSGFTNPICVYNAYDGIAVPVQIHKWKSDYIVILDSSGNTKPNNGIITGYLRNFGRAYWHLDKILLGK